MPETNITTSDKVVLVCGERAYNYYDMKPGAIERIDSHPQPDTMRGQNCDTPISEWTNYWFTFRHDDGSSAILDGSRICSMPTARAKGYPGADPAPRCYSCGATHPTGHTIGCTA